MASKLEMLLERIDPVRTHEQISASVDRAVNSFSMKRASLEWEECEDFLASFVSHMVQEVLKSTPEQPRHKEIYFKIGSNILDRKFGPNGWKIAFEMASTGKDGGLYRVLKVIAEGLAEEWAENTVSVHVSAFLDGLDADEKLAAADEYLQKYGHLLPHDLTSGNAWKVKAHFLEVLQEHPKLISRMRQISRDYSSPK